MKLIDILLAAGFKWPEGAAVVVQDYSGFTCSASVNCVFFDGDPDAGRWFRGEEADCEWFYNGYFQVADDYTTAIIARADWLAAQEQARSHRNETDRHNQKAAVA